MSMSVGEFFVNLGVKGSDKTVNAIVNVKKGMGGLASASLETKAAIVAAMYALERLFASSGQAGTGLTNFNSLLGTSARTIQEYQFAARQMGVANEEVTGTFKTLQAQMTKTLMGEGAPKGLARVAQLTGGINPEDFQKFQKNPEMLLQKLQEYAQKEKNLGLRNEVLKSFGLGDNMISALSRNAFRPDVFKKAPTYSDGEIKSLDRANIAWSNLGNKIEMAVGHFNAKHGGELVKDITKLIEPTLKLASAFTVLAEKLKVFEAAAWVVKELAGALNDISGFMNGKRSFWGEDLDAKGNVIGGKSSTHKAADFIKGMFQGKKHQGAWNNPYDSIAPNVKGAPGAGQDVSVQQNLYFQHDGKDAKKTGDSTRKAVQDYYRQTSAQGQST